MNWNYGKRPDFLLSLPCWFLILSFPSGFICLLIYFFVRAVIADGLRALYRPQAIIFVVGQLLLRRRRRRHTVFLCKVFSIGFDLTFSFSFPFSGCRFIFSFCFCIICSERWMLIPFEFVCDNNVHMVNTEQQENILVWLNLIWFSRTIHTLHITTRERERARKRNRTHAAACKRSLFATESTSFCVKVFRCSTAWLFCGAWCRCFPAVATAAVAAIVTEKDYTHI